MAVTLLSSSRAYRDRHTFQWKVRGENVNHAETSTTAVSSAHSRHLLTNCNYVKRPRKDKSGAKTRLVPHASWYYTIMASKVLSPGCHYND